MVEWLYFDLYIKKLEMIKKLRINKNDSLDIYYWREYKYNPCWFKFKILLCSRFNYKSYYIRINQKCYYLHRVVYKAYNEKWDIDDIGKLNKIDHINRNSLDNRIDNLRIVSSQENSFNTNAKGYSWDKKGNKWHAELMFNGKKVLSKRFDKEEDARESYLKAKEVYHKI
tara:strand:+ start:919 stop:1428 length:510 start_codon:yes stop_codon:yes gene_type:complete